MTKLRKKLLLSVLTLALTFIALGSTTFAWFTLGNTATANAFEGTVKGGDGIDIAFVKAGETITAENAKTTFQKYDWTMSVDLSTEVTKLTKLKFKDLTSADGINITDITSDVSKAKANEDYLEISLYVRSMGELSELNLTSLTDVLANEFSWNPDASVDGLCTVGTAKVWSALNALRVSFTVDGKSNDATKILEFATSSSNGQANNTSTGLAAKYAEAKKHTISSDKFGKITLPTTKTISITTNIADNYTTSIETVSLTDTNLLSGTATADAKYDYEDNGTHYYIYELVLRAWMEGWDGDCINAVLTKKVGFGFTLESKPKPASN